MQSKSLIALLLILFALGGATFAQDSSPHFAHSFGIVEGYWRPEASTDLGVSWDRITFDWSRFQPNGPGDFEQDVVRREWLTSNFENQRDVIGLIINTPAWASSSGLPTAVPDGLYLDPESPENLWAVFLRQLIQTYAPLGIHDWIIWNKPDIRPTDPGEPHTFDGNVADYYRLVKAAYLTIKSIDPEANVFLGGLEWWNDIEAGRENYLTAFLQTALNDLGAIDNNYYFDGVTLNIRIDPSGNFNNSTDSAGNITSTVRTLLNNNGLADKRIWITELNAAPTLDLLGELSVVTTSISLQQQSDFIVQAMALAMAAGAERIGVFKLFDSKLAERETLPFGLIRADNSLRPAFDAYRYAIQTFAPSESAVAGRSPNARLVVMIQANRTVYVMWTANTTPVNFWVESRFADELFLTDLFGNPLPPPRIGAGPDGVSVYVIDTPAATVDQSGSVLVSGSPRIFILNTSIPRPVWASLGNATGIRLN